MSNLAISAPLLFLLSATPNDITEPRPRESPVALAQVYEDEADLLDYWASEKLDGVRAYWDGESLFTRRGHRIHAPAWFLRGLPAEALDGELWMGRGTFDRLSGTVRRHTPDDEAWRQVRYMVFDLPSSPLVFDARLARLKPMAEAWSSSRVQLVRQFKVTDRDHLNEQLAAVVAGGGEGLMLRRGSSYYLAGRSRDLLKLKLFLDAEARVVGHTAGRGKYKGMLGALVVETSAGLRFRVGTGLTDAERQAPPPVGSWVTYRYNGVSKRGIPRFASFVRIAEAP